jgi:transcriptional regulator with XRE-family HTH domain
MTHHIGHDIRALRKSRGLTLRELSAAAGRSVGWLSEVERGQATPSVEDIAALARRLGVTISFFFRHSDQTPDERGLLTRAAQRMTIGTHAAGLTEELLSPSVGGAFEMIRSVFAPGSASATMSPVGEREDGGVVIEGRLTLILDGTPFALSPGDSFQFRGRDYAWRNDGDIPAVVLWVIAPPVY